MCQFLIGSDEPCPSESNFVLIFVKGLQRKFKKVPKKAFSISYQDLSLIFSKILGDSELESLSFVNLRFLTFILMLYSSFARYEEVCNLTLSDVEQEESRCVLNFYKGKSYQFGESNLGVVSNLPNLPFNPARFFPIYLDRVAALHARSNHCYNLLFPSCKVSKSLEVSLDKPLSYSYQDLSLILV